MKKLDRTTYELLFKKHYNPVCNYCNDIISDPELSQDIVQSVFVNLWKKKDEIEVKYEWSTYLYRAVKNRAIDEIRKQQTALKVKEAVKQTTVPNFNPEESPESSYEIKEKILKATRVLKPKCRNIFIMSKFEGLTYEEIAQHLKISKRAVEENIARALRLLRKEMMKTV